MKYELEKKMSNQELPLVSIIITTYKRSNYLSKSIDSVINQDYPDIEILVIDDNNPESSYRQQTEKLMKKYSNNDNVHYIKHIRNKNGAAARNTGLKYAEGKYVTYLDDDDTYRKKKVSKQVEFLEKNTEFDAVYCGWNKDGKEEAPTTEGNISFEILSGELLIRTNTIMMNRNIALNIGGWDENYRRNQEAVYLLRYFNDGYKIGSVAEILIDYDSTDRSNSSKPKQNEEDFLYFLNDHKNTIDNAAKKVGRKKEIIYSYRFRSVFLTYFKNKKFREALRFYTYSVGKLPIRFNVDLFDYTVKKLKGEI